MRKLKKKKMAQLIKYCIVCNKKFKVYPCRRYIAKYCSFKCRNKDYIGKHFSLKTEFKTGQEFTKERNEKIGLAHKGKFFGKRGRKNYYHVCKVCGKGFITKTQHRSICDNLLCQKQKAKLRVINPETEIKRRKKISKKLAGKIPKNLITNINMKNSPPQMKMFKDIKSYFPKAQYNYHVKTLKTRRWIDVALPKKKIGFEYNGKIHLMRSVKAKDKIRLKELEEMGWKIYILDRCSITNLNKLLKMLIQKQENDNGREKRKSYC